jgi:RNA polymerase sigma-70 factor (ECF subfamily)
MNIHNQDDYDLIKQYIAGDSSSLEVLISRHKNKVFSYIMMVVKKRELAEDIFQDTFIKVIKSLNAGKYSEEGRFVSWVMRIAHNLIIDFYRKNKNHKTVSDDDTEVPIFNTIKFSDRNIEDEIVLTQVHSDLNNVIEQLPKEQKEVVVLRYYKDYSFKEIAEATNVSINTALGRMRYAIINMRKIMEDANIDLITG